MPFPVLHLSWRKSAFPSDYTKSKLNESLLGVGAIYDEVRTQLLQQPE
jgi:hypothetical protein